MDSRYISISLANHALQVVILKVCSLHLECDPACHSLQELLWEIRTCVVDKTQASSVDSNSCSQVDLGADKFTRCGLYYY